MKIASLRDLEECFATITPRRSTEEARAGLARHSHWPRSRCRRPWPQPTAVVNCNSSFTHRPPRRRILLRDLRSSAADRHCSGRGGWPDSRAGAGGSVLNPESNTSTQLIAHYLHLLHIVVHTV